VLALATLVVSMLTLLVVLVLDPGRGYAHAAHWKVWMVRN